MEVPDHIDIRTDFSEVDLDTYREDVKERFALSAHPKVQNMTKRIEQMKTGAREAFEDAADLKAQAETKEDEAEAEAAQGNDSAADSLYEEAAELKQKADRRRRIAESKTRTLQKWIRDTDAAQAISPVVDRPNELVSGMDAPAQTKRDRVQQQAEQELRQAAEKEMEYLMAHLKEQADPFLDALEKAKALDTDSATAGGFGRTLNVLSGVDVKAAGGARQGLDEKLEDVFAEYGVA